MSSEAFKWTISGLIYTRGINYLLQVSLMAFFLPEQLGVVAILMAIIGVCNILLTFGVDVAIISKENPTPSFIKSAWVVDVFRGFILTAILFLSADEINSFFFNDQDLSRLIRILSLIFFIQSLKNIGLAVYRKELNLKPLIAIECLSGTSVIVLTITFLLIDRSIASVIYGHVSGVIIFTVLSYFFCGYRISGTLSYIETYKNLKFSSWVMVNGQVNALLEYGMVFLLSRFSSSSNVGINDRIELFGRKSSQQVTEIFWRVGLPQISKVKSKNHDRVKLLKSQIRIALAISSLVMSLIYIIISTLFEFNFFNFATEWSQLKKYLLFSVFMGFNSTLYSMLSINYLALGMPGILFRLSIIRLILTIFTLFVFGSISIFNIQISLAVGLILTSIISIYISKIDVSIMEFIRLISPSLIIFLAILFFNFFYYFNNIYILPFVVITPLILFLIFIAYRMLKNDIKNVIYDN